MVTRLPLPLLLFLAAVSTAHAAEPAPYKAKPGPDPVASFDVDWKDTARNATVPVRIYHPKDLGTQPRPLIIFSHGLGGSRTGYQAYGEHWASHGYIVVHPTHVGSDTSIILNGNGGIVSNLREGISAQSAQNRMHDVSFIITQFEKINAGTLNDTSAAAKTLAAFKDRIDIKHVGMSGHSFGAQTTLAVSGTVTKIGPITRSSPEPRITAAIALSPQPTALPDQKTAFGSIKIPVFCITGTHDDGPPGISDVKAAERRIPYDNLPGPDDYFVIYNGANHMTFGINKEGNTPGRRIRQAISGSVTPVNSPQQEAAIHSLVLQSTTAFWDAYLRQDPKAKTWLQSDFPRLLANAGKFETKAGPK